MTRKNLALVQTLKYGNDGTQFPWPELENAVGDYIDNSLNCTEDEALAQFEFKEFVKLVKQTGVSRLIDQCNKLT